MKKSIVGISMITITCLYGLLAAVVILITMLAGGEVLYAIIGSIVVLIIQFLISPWLTDVTMRLFYKANFNAEIPDYLKKFIELECKKHNVVYPKIGIIEDGGPNAFTYGRTKKDARIVITRGIFDLLNENEVKSVVGHELGHIVHMDMLVMTFAQVVPLVLYAIYEMFTRIDDSDSDNKATSYLKLIGFLAYVLYVISEYVILWLSRQREYYADRFSVTETENPSALAEALVKIGFGLSTAVSQKNDVSKRNALGIFDKGASKAMSISSYSEKGVDKNKIKNAMKWEMWNPWAKWYELNSTHPLISKRLEAISNMSEEFKQKPYIKFDLKKEESYVDDFLIELVICYMPVICFFATVICAIVIYVETNNPHELLLPCGFGLLLFSIFTIVKFNRSHKTNYKDKDVSDLLGEVKVSRVTSVACNLKGKIIGRGNPGCIFNEDFVIKDKTGIIFLDYNQPLNIINKIFALFKSKEYFDKEVSVKGWYRRCPVPYVEIYEYTVDGKTKKIYTYAIAKTFNYILFISSIILIAFSLI